MSDMFEQFETDSVLEAEGVWVDYGAFRVQLARAGGANKKYLAYAEAKTKPLRRAIAAQTMTEEQSRALLYDIYAKTVVLNWQIENGVDEEGRTIWKNGIHKKGGGNLEVSHENIVATFKLLPALFTDLQQAAEGIGLFRKEEMEADSKNL